MTEEGPLNNVDEPRRETDPVEDMTDPVMVNRVERLGGVEEKKEAVILLGDRLIKEGVDVDDVVPPIFTCQKTLLAGRDVGTDRRHDGTCDARGQQPIVCVGDGEGAGVGNQTSELFREEKEEPVVKALGGVMAPEDSTKGTKEKRGGKVGGGAPGRERDTVRARGSVLRPGDGI